MLNNFLSGVVGASNMLMCVVNIQEVEFIGNLSQT